MKKSAIALCLMAVSMTASAEWVFNNRGVGESNPDGYPSIYLLPDGLVEIELGGDCSDSSNTFKNNMIINGISVKMVEYCDSDTKKYSHYPQTKKGNEYLINQLLTKDSLTVEGIEIPSKGFKPIWDQVQMKKEGGL